MKKIYTLTWIIFFLVFSNNLFSQNWIWEKAGGSVGEDGIFSVAIDNGGSVIAAGYFTQTLNIPGQSPLNPSGPYDAFLAKYTPAGTLQWFIQIGGPGIDYIADITVDGDGNVYVAGNFEGSVIIGSTASNAQLLTTNAPYTYFVAKFGSNGVRQWSVSGNYLLGGVLYPHEAFSLDQRDGGNQVILTGAVLYNNNGIVNYDVFVHRLDGLGNLVNGWKSSSAFDEIGTGVKFDNSGNIVLTGYYLNQANLPNTTSPLSGQGYDMFIAKYSNNLNPIWQKTAGSTGYDGGGGIAVDGNNNIFVTGLCQGAYFGTIQVPSFGGPDFFVAKYKPNGDVEWARSGGSNGEDLTSEISVGPDGSLYLLGSFEGNCNLGNGTTISSNGNKDILLIKYNPDGTVGWHTQIGSAGLDVAGDVAVGNSCRVVVGGGFSNTITLSTPITSFSGNIPDFFITVLDIAPAAPTISANGSTVLCPGQTLQLTAANVCSGCTVNWYNNGQLAQSGNSITVSAPGNYTAKVFNPSNAIACQSSGDSNPITVTNVSAPSTPTISANGNPVLCPPNGSVTLTVGNVCSGCDVRWYNNGQLLPQLGNTITVSVPGNYTVTALNSNNCESSPSVALNVSQSTFVATITVNGCNLSAPNGSNYNWFVNGVLIPGATSQTYQALQNGAYTVSMLSPDNCTATSQPVTVNCLTPTTEVFQTLNLHLWPNPAKGKVNIGFSLAENVNLSVELVSVTGQKFRLIGESQYVVGEHTLELDISAFSSGIYMVKIGNENGMAFRKLVILE